MAQITLLSTLLMGLLLIGIAVGIARVRNWRQEGPSIRGAPEAPTAALNTPTAWTLLFAVLAFGFGAGALVFVGGVSVPSLGAGAVGTAMIAAFAIVLVAYLFAGIYVSARSRGLASSQAAAVGSTVVGLLFVAAIVVQLFVGG